MSASKTNPIATTVNLFRAVTAILLTTLALALALTPTDTSAQGTLPGAPTNLAAEVFDATTIQLTWTAPTVTNGTLTGYKIEKKDGSSWELLDDTSDNRANQVDTTYVDPDVPENGTRSYRVSAINANGTGSPSNEVTATAANPPMTLIIATATKSGIQLEFDSLIEQTSVPPKSAFTVKVEGVSKPIHSVAYPSVAFQTTFALEPVTDFRAGEVITVSYREPSSNPIVNPIGVKADEFTDFAVENHITNTRPTAPTNIQADDGGDATSYDITWDPAWHNGSPILRYEVRVDDGTWTTVTGGDSARSHTVTGLVSGAEYRFQIRAVNVLGNGPEVSIFVPENPVTFTMYVTNVSITRGSSKAGQARAPLIINASGAVSSDTTFTLTWNGRPVNELHPDNPASITIKAGQSNARVFLKAAPDNDNPRVYNQKVTANVVATLGSLQLRYQLTVFDDESLPVVTLSAPATVDEGDNFRVTATLQHRLDVDTTVPVNMHNPSHMTVPGYSWPYPPISIPAGQLTGQTQEIRKQQDSDEDGYGDLAFGVNGISPYHWWPSRQDATVRVTDDDTNDPNKRRYSGWPRLYMDDANATESGDPDTVVKIRFPITLYPTSRSTITVDYRTEDDSAKAGVNYRSTNGTLTFAPREKQQVVEVDVLYDGLGGHTSFRFIAVGPNGGGAEIGTYYVTGRIYDETPTFRSWPESTRESGNGQEAYMNFHVSLLDFNKHGTYTVDYATSDGTARADSDYTAVSGTLTFALGEGYKQVTVPILDDSIEDSGETFQFILSNPTGAHS